MSSIIRVLEDLGSNPGISGAHPKEYAASIADSELNAPQRLAFLSRDAKALGDLAGARGTFRCLIATPE